MSEPDAGLRQQAAKGLKWRAIDIVGRQCLSFVVFIVLARLLQPADFGALAVIITYLSFINIFVEQGMSTALVQREPLQAQHLNAAFWFNLGTAGVLAGATALSADVLCRFAGVPSAGPVLRLASVGLVINAAGSVHTAKLIKDIDFRHLTTRTLLGNAIGGIVGIVMALRGYGVWALVWQQLVTYLVGASFLWIVVPWRPSLDFSRQHLRELLQVSSSVFLTSILWTLASRVDQLVIGRFAGAAVLGQYVVGVKLADIARSGVQETIATVSMPALSKVQNDHARLRHVIYSAMELLAVVVFAVFIGLAAVGPSIVPLAFGPQWTQAGSVLQLVAVYGLAMSLTILFYPALLASGGVGRYVVINAVNAIGAVVACLVGIRFGIHVLVLLMTANILFASWLALLYLRARIGLDVAAFCRPCLLPAAAATLMFIAVTTMRMGTGTMLPLWLETALEVAVGAAVYIAVIWTFSRSTLMWLWRMLVMSMLPSRAIVAPAAATLRND